MCRAASAPFSSGPRTSHLNVRNGSIAAGPLRVESGHFAWVGLGPIFTRRRSPSGVLSALRRIPPSAESLSTACVSDGHLDSFRLGRCCCALIVTIEGGDYGFG